MKYIKKIHNQNFSLVTYFFLVVIRIGLVFLPQNGYIHPDEFFQSTEIINGSISISYMQKLKTNLKSF